VYTLHLMKEVILFFVFQMVLVAKRKESGMLPSIFSPSGIWHQHKTNLAW
jgi:hypothetical protein